MPELLRACQPISTGRRGARIAVMLVAGLSGAAAAHAQAGPQAPPPAVTTTVVQEKDVSPEVTLVGNVEAIQTFNAQARVEGYLKEVDFQGGQDVKKGQLLYVIDPAVYEAQLAAAQAQQQQAEATLRQDEQAYARAQQLQKTGAGTAATLDQARAARDVAQAQVAAAQATVQQARINVGYTRITSPIEGRIGTTNVTVGNVVGPTSGILATVVQLDPIRVAFSISDSDLLNVLQRYGAKSPSELTSRFVPQLRLSNGSAYPSPGKIAFVNNQVDPATGTVTVRAVFPNPDNILLPGEYVSVTVRPQQTTTRPVVPMAAVQRDRQGAYVLTLDQANRVHQQRIKTGIQVGQDLAVTDGLEAGQTIVLGGVQKVRPGMVVAPTPAPDGDSGSGGAQPGTAAPG